VCVCCQCCVCVVSVVCVLCCVRASADAHKRTRVWASVFLDANHYDVESTPLLPPSACLLPSLDLSLCLGNITAAGQRSAGQEAAAGAAGECARMCVCVHACVCMCVCACVCVHVCVCMCVVCGCTPARMLDGLVTLVA